MSELLERAMKTANEADALSKRIAHREGNESAIGQLETFAQARFEVEKLKELLIDWEEHEAIAKERGDKASESAFMWCRISVQELLRSQGHNFPRTINPRELAVLRDFSSPSHRFEHQIKKW